MIRTLSALVATVAFSLCSVACVAPTEEAEVETTSDEVVSRGAYFETFEGQDGQFYFNLVAANGEGVLRSEGYTRKASAEKGIASVTNNGRTPERYSVKQSDNGDYYFTLEAANGEPIGISQMYTTKYSAERGVVTAQRLLAIIAGDVKAAPRQERFEIFTGEDGKTYFRLRAGNGEIMLASQGYTTVQSARKGIASVQTNGVLAEQFEVTETADGDFYVVLTAKNGETIARGQAYSSKSNATRAVERLGEILAVTLPTATR